MNHLLSLIAALSAQLPDGLLELVLTVDFLLILLLYDLLVCFEGIQNPFLCLQVIHKHLSFCLEFPLNLIQLLIRGAQNWIEFW